MNYRELQAEARRLGVSASGKKADLEARVAAAQSGDAKPKSNAGRKPGSKLRSFVFTGDPRDLKAGTNDPEYTRTMGYRFELNGKPVKVKAEVAEKLQGNAHFKEV